MTNAPCSALRRFLARTLLAALATAGGAAAAQAASLQVTVLTANGQPAVDTVVQVVPTGRWAARPLPPTTVIGQKDIRFQPYVSVVPLGGSVRFTNRDSFDHHVRSTPGGPLGSVAPAKEFEFRLSAAGGGRDVSPDLLLDRPGSITLGCHLHGSMRGHLYVASTPFVGVTDAQGRVQIDDLPTGAAELRLWHPDQLLDQPTTTVQLPATTATEATLNFSPRRRRAR